MQDVPDTETNTPAEQLVAAQGSAPVAAVMPRVVIVGAGFAGIHAARARAPTRISHTHVGTMEILYICSTMLPNRVLHTRESLSPHFYVI